MNEKCKIDFFARAQFERDEDWDKWVGEIPYIKFHEDWEVKVVPPFTGAMVRFQIRKGDKECVSVYLDVYDRLGCYGEPYWEIYPYHGDTFRCGMMETDKLLEAIEESLKETTEKESDDE